MPRSRSRSIASRTCASISRACSAPVSSRKRSASVDLPWSMWAMTAKLRTWRESNEILYPGAHYVRRTRTAAKPDAADGARKPAARQSATRRSNERSGSAGAAARHRQQPAANQEQARRLRNCVHIGTEMRQDEVVFSRPKAVLAIEHVKRSDIVGR